jgi:deoxyadenosine/deoxycytidine kinase
MKPEMYPIPEYDITPDLNKRILYLVGPHGTGKSTIIKDLKSYDENRVREQIAHMESIDENITRQVWRIGLHCVEHRENLAYAKTQPNNSVVIGDRCYIDDHMYMDAFVKLGWMKKDVVDDLKKAEVQMYAAARTPLPEMFIVLLPPLDWNIARIEERWTKGEPVKWCEHNYEYLKVVREQFNNLCEFQFGSINKTKSNILKLTDTDPINRIREIKKFIEEKDLDDFIIEGKILVESQSKWGS